MRALLATLLVLAGLSGSGGLAQEKAGGGGEAAAGRRAPPEMPVVFGKKGDGLPERFKARGVITEVSFAPADCGTIFWSGTIKIELLDKVEGYPHEDVFVVVPCFVDPGGEGKYLKKTVGLRVSKQYEDHRYDARKPCYFEIIINTINSRGVPFYCSEEGREGILKSIGRQAAARK